LFLITVVSIPVYDQFSFIKIIVGVNTVSHSFASFVGAGHFLLDAFLEGLVKFLTMLLAGNVNFFANLLKVQQRPSLDHPHGKWLVPLLLVHQ
jgi:hypothetical protein